VSISVYCLHIDEPGHHAPQALVPVDHDDPLPTVRPSICHQCKTLECAPSRRVCSVCISRRQETRRRRAGLPPTTQKDTP
jgi:hypothetical protein